jgi:hypothetical protein
LTTNNGNLKDTHHERPLNFPKKRQIKEKPTPNREQTKKWSETKTGIKDGLSRNQTRKSQLKVLTLLISH